MSHLHPVAQELVAGNQRFLTAQSQQSSALSLLKLKEFADNGQAPKAIVLCCSDSRAPVEMIFDQDLGDLFVIRVAGNVVAPSLVGSVEYAVSTFGTNFVVVMGHTECGAVKATLDHIENPALIPSLNLHDILGRIMPYVMPISQLPIPYEEKLSRSVLTNVRASVSGLTHGSSLIENWVLKGELTVMGAVLDLHTGVVEFLED